MPQLTGDKVSLSPGFDVLLEAVHGSKPLDE
ncbi:uncharacterized protein METZ01_LOCUS220430, partial [marine metagenome]